MQLHYWWWILALGLGVLELMTGTFYLLVLAAGCAAGGLAAWFGAGLTVQVLATAAVAIAGWVWLWRRSPWRQTSDDLAIRTRACCSTSASASRSTRGVPTDAPRCGTAAPHGRSNSMRRNRPRRQCPEPS